jgi:hypothetical protein
VETRDVQTKKTSKKVSSFKHSIILNLKLFGDKSSWIPSDFSTMPNQTNAERKAMEAVSRAHYRLSNFNQIYQTLDNAQITRDRAELAAQVQESARLLHQLQIQETQEADYQYASAHEVHELALTQASQDAYTNYIAEQARIEGQRGAAARDVMERNRVDRERVEGVEEEEAFHRAERMRQLSVRQPRVNVPRGLILSNFKDRNKASRTPEPNLATLIKLEARRTRRRRRKVRMVCTLSYALR